MYMLKNRINILETSTNVHYYRHGSASFDKMFYCISDIKNNSDSGIFSKIDKVNK